MSVVLNKQKSLHVWKILFISSLQGKETITSYILRSAYAVTKLISLIGAISRLHLCKMQGKRLSISQKFAGLDIIGDHARQKG